MAAANSTFIIRLWTTPASLGMAPGQSRGRIDHVQSGDHLYFDRLPEAVAFLQRHFKAYEVPPARNNQEPPRDANLLSAAEIISSEEDHIR